MRTRLLGVLVGAALAFPATAAAAPVLVMGRGGHVTVQNNRFLTGPALTPTPDRASAIASSAGARNPSALVYTALARLSKARAISATAYPQYRSAFGYALESERRLSGTRRTELGAVIGTIEAIARAHELSASRLPALFLTLERNQQWWTAGPLLSYGQRVQFKGSEIVWEYYPGQGIQLQVLGTFGEADGYYTAGKADYPKLKEVLSEMIPLAAQRGGGKTWEYYFSFDGGSPPWTSAMSQGTAIEALTRAYQAFKDPSYLTTAASALPIFSVAPTIGVKVRTSRGARYLQYSFAPSVSILNAFLQSLIGLYDFAHVSHNTRAQRLFAAGNAEAQSEVPHFIAGGWSLYQPGVVDTLSYHQLVTGFLGELCSRTSAHVYCATAKLFNADLTTRPALTLLTKRVRGGSTASISFDLSKYAHVGIVVLRGATTVFSTSTYEWNGTRSLSVGNLSPGSYTIHLTATDLAGNFTRVVGGLSVS